MPLQAVERAWSPAAVHDSVQAVLRDPAFTRSLRRTLFDRAFAWLLEWLNRLQRALKGLPSTRSIGLTVIGLVVLVLVVRAVLAARKEASDQVQAKRRRSGLPEGDPWASADVLAAEQRFEEAAHALYHGVLRSLERTDRVRLDPARTSGDYARELRRRGSPSVALFRSFPRRFESAVYGHERCTAEVYTELRALSDSFRPRARAA